MVTFMSMIEPFDFKLLKLFTLTVNPCATLGSLIWLACILAYSSLCQEILGYLTVFGGYLYYLHDDFIVVKAILKTGYCLLPDCLVPSAEHTRWVLVGTLCYQALHFGSPI